MSPIDIIFRYWSLQLAIWYDPTTMWGPSITSPSIMLATRCCQL